MALREHRFDPPDRFVVGTVGEPGQRTFFLQARAGSRLVSVACEKEQVRVLAEQLQRVLDEVGDTSMGLPRPHDREPLDAPIEEEFRVGTITLAWDPNDARVIIELFSVDQVDDPEVVDLGPDAMVDDIAEVASAAEHARAEEVVIVRISPDVAERFVQRADRVIEAGRPACPFCAQPVDPSGHICPRSNGLRRPLFA